ncbi:MAG: FAD-dependent oxidoreductase [Candidatus Thorarchaeota archaeon]
MEASVLVVGGGIAGIQASLDLTELGFKVYLVEKQPSIGGHMAQLDKLFPSNDCSLCVLAPRMVAVYKNPNICLFTLSEVKDVKGSVGNFKVTILKKPRYIVETKCKGCGDCAAKCPKIEAPNPFDMNLGKRKSVYMPFPQATPPVYLIDPNLCLYLNRGVCGVCKKVCKGEAIDFEQKEELIDINIGAIVVATGFDMLSTELSDKWGYNFKNVLNGLEYERLLCPTGPFGGIILRPSDEQQPQKIAFIQCVDTGNGAKDNSYCSRVCCMYTAKNAILTKRYSKDIEIAVFRHNIRVFGKNFYEYTKQAQEQYNINYIHSDIKIIKENPETNDLIIQYHDLKTGEDKDYKANMAILAAPLSSSKGTNELAKILNIELDQYNFFQSKSYFDKSLSSRDGIFLCGFSQGPTNIAETVSHASGVAGQVAIMLNEVRFKGYESREIGILPEEEIIKITPKALILGGGISGITAALDIASQGFETLLIERDNILGGNLNHINILSPTGVKASEFLASALKKVKENKHIKTYLNSQILKMEGFIGNYKVTYIQNGNKLLEETVGVIIVATGSQEFKPFGQFQYLKGNPNVITLLELEQRLKEEGDSWLKRVRHITVIMCVKSRQKDGFSYCSNVCCNNAIKNIKILKELNPKVEILVLFRDIHQAKKEFEEIFNQKDRLAKFLRYDLENIPEVIKVHENIERYKIRLRDDFNRSKELEFNTDLIILSTPMIPPEGVQQLSEILNIPIDQNGFFIEAHHKLRPLEFSDQGIFICGSAQWPKNIQDSISQANGAAGRASRFLNIKQISATKLKFLSFLLSFQCYFKDMIVNEEKCNGCGQCVDLCAFKAISLLEITQTYEDVTVVTRKAHINPAHCKGCGKCSSNCRLKAINARHYDFKQISSIIDPYFLEKTRTEEKILLSN